ncbi:Sec-independent protein translocase protein TatB [Pseudorhodoplanes sinuspersici]|uniref:Sec-independent protein translocase protein TatB n=1 Tax=Pseudorhodoplanes sinuspersici TaxID=1235591 RepID=A0A1W6ZWQ2_9HYPH|nr:Sec-independent protein translocase protein TatB [Pseudorhodoplanes sinuspersici]ARQ01794.1 twin-arginine translocase subunit TatB [Pseudorhodoplanes sinuspersici]RKE73547.1 sec-independent protein translocase protein TatB [Pseudorhodoplanes sinuspersici]
MFDLSWSELILIGVVALIAIGPKELPGVLRALGHWMGKIRRMAGDFQDQFREAMREAEVADLKRQFDEASAKATAGFTNPLESAQKEVEKAFGTEPSASDPSSSTVATPESTVTTTDPGAIEPSASAPIAEPPPSVVPEPETAGAPMDIKPADVASNEIKPGGSGAA